MTHLRRLHCTVVAWWTRGWEVVGSILVTAGVFPLEKELKLTFLTSLTVVISHWKPSGETCWNNKGSFKGSFLICNSIDKLLVYGFFAFRFISGFITERGKLNYKISIVLDINFYKIFLVEYRKFNRRNIWYDWD
jgi:hypothetical protein